MITADRVRAIRSGRFAGAARTVLGGFYFPEEPGTGEKRHQEMTPGTGEK